MSEPITPIRVIVESPYSGDIEENIKYALLCMKDSYTRGEAPFLSHLLYTRIPSGEHISDSDSRHQYMTREYGLSCCLEWRKVASKTILYVDNGISSGMKQAKEEAEKMGQPVEIRKIRT